MAELIVEKWDHVTGDFVMEGWPRCRSLAQGLKWVSREFEEAVRNLGKMGGRAESMVRLEEDVILGRLSVNGVVVSTIEAYLDDEE